MSHTSVKSFMIALSCVVAIMMLTSSLRADDVGNGRAYYLRYCASCHGENADGQGAVAKVLKERPPDLRRLSERYGMPLPAGRIAQFIDGRAEVAAHGSRAMPVWGRRFAEIWSAHQAGSPEMAAQINDIVKYLNSIQLAGHPAKVPEDAGTVEKPVSP